MKTYLLNLFSEKGIDRETPVTVNAKDGTPNYMTLQNVIDFVLKLDLRTQKSIRSKFVIIDFHNGDIMNFVRYIAEGMAVSF